MEHPITRSANAVALENGGQRLSLSWSRNRIHYHPRVFRLSFAGFEGANAELMREQASALLSEALTVLSDQQPLLFRVTIEHDAHLLPLLQELGFLFARGVHLVAIDVPTLLRSPVRALPGHLRMRSLNESTALVSTDDLTAVWAEAYGRAARLDPATLGELTVEELHALFPGDQDLDAHLTVCAFEGNQLVGVCPVYRGDDDLVCELGTVGVADPWVAMESEISMAMLGAMARRAASMGVQRLIVEVDADAPSSVYLYADVPGRVLESLISLMYVPKWGHL